MIESKYKIQSDKIPIYNNFYLESNLKNSIIEDVKYEKKEKIELKNYEFRKANNFDVKDIYKIEIESFETPYPQELFSKIINESFDEEIFVFLIDSEIVGYLLLCADTETQLNISSIAVLKKMRGYGIGKIFVQETINYSKKYNFKTINLHVNENNISAQKIYSKFGFKTKDWQNNYYQNENCDALYMELDVSDI
jgi:[ribosomal protein S18]-alanine N-acetyltransferase